MSVKAGFLLPSLVIYMAILILLTATAVRLVTFVMPPAYKLISWSAITDIYTAYDCIYKELSVGPADPALWYQFDNEGIIWAAGERTKGFIITRGDLIYKEGTYNPTTQSWSGSASSLLAHNMQFQDNKIHAVDNKISGVTVHAQSTHYPEHQWWCSVTFPSAP